MFLALPEIYSCKNKSVPFKERQTNGCLSLFFWLHNAQQCSGAAAQQKPVLKRKQVLPFFL
jgi:hypothetical protein